MLILSGHSSLSGWKIFAIIYLALLACSHAVRFFSPPETAARPDQNVLTLNALAHDRTLPQHVKLAYDDLQPDNVISPPVVLLLHGSPVTSITFKKFAPELAQSCRVLVPDLPGFGQSTLRIPDYSIRSHAAYVLQMLDSLRLSRVHIVAYSMSGGVALHLAERAPERIQSITMVSALGVQELELLGDYHLNHAVHGLQLAFLWFVQEGVPHFGYLDDAFLNVPYARNFFDSDQRPLRAILTHYQNPMLIVHGRHDPLVPLAAAQEHYRLVPQSELLLFEGGHELIFSKPHMIAKQIEAFIQQAEQGRRLTRSQAPPERLALAQQPFDPSQIPQAQGIALVTLVFLLALATLVSEDLTCISAGLLVARGTMGYFSATLGCFLGIVFGDFLLFFAGKYLGGPALRRAPMKWFFNEDAITRGRRWFEREGAKVIVLSRFMPGSRLPTYVAAGLLRMSFWKFCGYFVLAAALWTPALVAVSTLLGGQVMEYLSLYEQYSWRILIGLAVVLWFMAKLVVPLFSFRGRRLLVSKWRRLTQWEFWPLWAFYPPVIFYVLYLGLKHRSLTVFTAANPAIFTGGFLGESKSDILNRLVGADGYIARHRLICVSDNEEQRVQAVKNFMQEFSLSFPIVLKPDVGQRGAGVSIVRSEQEMRDYFRQSEGHTIAQEYASGYEYGVFYYRHPDQARGSIFAITDKRFPVVKGDGRSTLEELILKDSRAVCMARFLLNKHHARLFEVPAAGEVIPLVELGTHCRGAIFYDGEKIRTPELEASIDAVSRHFEGFYFGRYDIRTPSPEDFKQGKNFKVIELNGVTSEATSIYDPGNSLFKAYRVLMKQWRIAFEIGALNRARGIRPVPLRELIRVVRNSFGPAKAQEK